MNKFIILKAKIRNHSKKQIILENKMLLHIFQLHTLTQIIHLLKRSKFTMCFIVCKYLFFYFTFRIYEN